MNETGSKRWERHARGTSGEWGAKLGVKTLFKRGVSVGSKALTSETGKKN